MFVTIICNEYFEVYILYITFKWEFDLSLPWWLYLMPRSTIFQWYHGRLFYEWWET